MVAFPAASSRCSQLSNTTITRRAARCAQPPATRSSPAKDGPLGRAQRVAQPAQARPVAQGRPTMPRRGTPEPAQSPSAPPVGSCHSRPPPSASQPRLPDASRIAGALAHDRRSSSAVEAGCWAPNRAGRSLSAPWSTGNVRPRPPRPLPSPAHHHARCYARSAENIPRMVDVVLHRSAYARWIRQERERVGRGRLRLCRGPHRPRSCDACERPHLHSFWPFSC